MAGLACTLYEVASVYCRELLSSRKNEEPFYMKVLLQGRAVRPTSEEQVTALGPGFPSM